MTGHSVFGIKNIKVHNSRSSFPEHVTEHSVTTSRKKILIVKDYLQIMKSKNKLQPTRTPWFLTTQVTGQ